MNRLTFFSLLLFFACNSKREAHSNIFYYNETTGISSLDPSYAKNQSNMWAVHQLYNTLVEVDNNLHMAPSLAKSWDISEDRLTYTFYLRNDVFFHDDGCFPGNKGR